MRIASVMLIWLFAYGIAQAAWQGAITTPYWRIQSPAGTIRWLEIHGGDVDHTDGLYHVQVLEREVGSPAWKFHSLAAHMALTETALRTSIVGIAKERSVYPEAFESGYRNWQELKARGNAPICKSEVAKCL